MVVQSASACGRLFSAARPELGEGLLDRVQVRTVRWQVEQAGTSASDRDLDARDLVGAAVVPAPILRTAGDGVRELAMTRWGTPGSGTP
jgi:hypothetical protein